MRGLKSGKVVSNLNVEYVAPLAGAWIEILAISRGSILSPVAPLAGAWIEIGRAYPVSECC